jgi:hypothetical protein
MAGGPSSELIRTTGEPHLRGAFDKLVGSAKAGAAP